MYMYSNKNLHFFTKNSKHIQIPLPNRENFTTTILILAIKGGHICSDAERDLLAIPVKFGSLDLQNVVQVANLELSNFKEIPKDLTENVIL